MGYYMCQFYRNDKKKFQLNSYNEEISKLPIINHLSLLVFVLGYFHGKKNCREKTNAEKSLRNNRQKSTKTKQAVTNCSNGSNELFRHVKGGRSK